ncbi:hypothetical protein GCM10028798_05740 [Humibacter antri]
MESAVKQHLVSKVLLQRFADASGELQSYDLVHGRSRPRHPSAIAWRDDFVDHEPATLEQLWWTNERHMAVALDAVEEGTALNDPKTTTTLKQAIALHFVRRSYVKKLFETNFAHARATVTAPMDFPFDRDAFRADVQERLDEVASEIFALDLRNLYARVAQHATSSRLEVVHSEAPLLISDVAVLSFKGEGGTGFLPFAEASTHVLPVGRHHLVALGPADVTIELPPTRADQLNEQQILHAGSHVFFHPGDDLQGFVGTVRARNGAGEQPLSQARE